MADNTDNRADSAKRAAWYQSEAFKTAATILVILMIPVAAFAWNVLSGNGSIGDLNNLFNTSSTSTEREGEDVNTDDPDDQDDNIASGTSPGNAQNNINSGNQANKGMPNTSSAWNHKVVQGDTLESLSRKYCNDLDFYYENMDKNIVLTEGKTIKVSCN